MNPTPNQAAKARDDLAAVAASQAELTEAWAALGVAKAAAKDAEVLVDKVAAAEGRIPPLVEAAVRQEASAAAAASKAAELTPTLTPHLPTSPHISPVSPYISLHLPISPSKAA